MTVPRVAEPGSLPLALKQLLTVISQLRRGLEGLPSPETTGYYGALTHVISQWMPTLYVAYDRYLSAALITEGKRIRCGRNCSACCNHFVSSVEPFELLFLDQHIKTRDDYPDLVLASYRREVLYKDLVGPDGEDEEAEDRALYRYFLRGQACPFLESDGACGVYERRPMACRMFYSESAPRFCAGKALTSPWNRNFQVELPQEAEEALARCARLLEHLELPEDLFPGVTAVNALFGRYASPSADAASSADP